MNEQHVTLLVLLDLSAAFDTNDHQVLLSRLKDNLGISETTLSWFQDYLSCRCQRISVEGSLSKKFDVTCCVPQGSCLGPLLFIIYASDLFRIIKQHKPQCQAYDDDTQLLFFV